MALIRLGASTITSLTDGTTEANLCNSVFDIVARRAMMQGSWTTTIRRATLARTTNTPNFKYTYEYQLPVDPKCLKVIGINETLAGNIEFDIESDKLLTDEASVKIEYIAELSDVETYGPYLTEVVELLLASYLAYPLTGKAQLADALKRDYMETSMRNLAMDGKQGSKDFLISEDLITVRLLES